MKYVDGVLEFDRVHRSIGISAMVLDYFEDPWSFPSPRFRAWVLATKLRNAESGSNFIDHRLRESQQVILLALPQYLGALAEHSGGHQFRCGCRGPWRNLFAGDELSSTQKLT